MSAIRVEIDMDKRFLRCLLFAIAMTQLLAFGAVPAALANHGPAAGMLGREEGMPSTQVHAVVEGPLGAMWFAGPSGLSRYDGSSIEVYGPRDGLSTQGLRALAADPTGTIWIGHDRGFDKRDPDGSITPVSAEDWSFGFVDVIAVAEEVVWLGTSTGVIRWTEESGAILIEDVPRGLVTGLAVVGDTIWVSGPSVGVWRMRAGAWVRVTADAIRAIEPVHALSTSPEGLVWLGGSAGAVVVDGPEITPIGLVEEDAGRVITSLMPVDQDLWIASNGNLESWTKAVDGTWSRGDRLMGNLVVNQLVMDVNANVWIATDSDGVAKVSVLRRAVSHGPMPCDTQVYSIRSVPSGGYLIGGEQCSWHIDSPESHPEAIAGLDGIKVWDLIQAQSGAMWAATQLGLFHAEPDSTFTRAPAGRIAAIPGRALLERGNVLWVATVEGLFMIESSGAREVLDSSGQSLGYVYTLAEDNNGRLWIGTIGGGVLHEDDAGRLVAPGGPLLSADSNVYAIAHDGAGASALIQDDAVLYFNGADWVRLAAATADNVAGWSLYFADPENLWLGSSNGLVHYRLPEGVVLRRLTATMGLAGSEFTTSRSLAPASEGRLMLGLDSGLSIVDPVELGKLSTAPVLHLSAVNWNQASVEERGSLPLVAYGPWTLDLRLSSSWFVDEHGLQYRFKLEGFDQDWSAAVHRTQAVARYTGLPSGEYRFMAQVFSPLFGWGDEEELYRFEVDRPWWARPAMLVLWVLAAGLLFAALVWWRTRTLRIRANELEEIVRTRTGELQEANSRLEQIVSQDSLTGVMNRRALWAEADRFRAIATREHLSLGLIVFDLDHFKSINDRFGHPIGDAVLVHVAGVISDMLRKGEVLARWGGEEFIVLLAPASESPDLWVAAERVRKALEDHPYSIEGGPMVSLTCSVGACQWAPEGDSFEDVLKRADQALYRAKRDRNSSAVWAPDWPDSP